MSVQCNVDRVKGKVGVWKFGTWVARFQIFLELSMSEHHHRFIALQSSIIIIIIVLLRINSRTHYPLKTDIWTGAGGTPPTTGVQLATAHGRGELFLPSHPSTDRPGAMERVLRARPFHPTRCHPTPPHPPHPAAPNAQPAREARALQRIFTTITGE